MFWFLRKNFKPPASTTLLVINTLQSSVTIFDGLSFRSLFLVLGWILLINKNVNTPEFTSRIHPNSKKKCNLSLSKEITLLCKVSMILNSYICIYQLMCDAKKDLHTMKIAFQDLIKNLCKEKNDKLLAIKHHEINFSSVWKCYFGKKISFLWKKISWICVWSITAN